MHAYQLRKKTNVIQREPKKVIGIDVGVRHFLTDSEGRQVENPKFYKTLQRIKVLQHWSSKKKRGSKNKNENENKNREKMRIKMANVYERLTNQLINHSER